MVIAMDHIFPLNIFFIKLIFIGKSNGMDSGNTYCIKV